MYQITITKTFKAVHALKLFNGEMEKKHGHQWVVRVTVASAKLDGMGCVMDFHLLQAITEQILGQIKHQDLNKTPPFAGKNGELKINPSAETVAQWIGQTVKKGLPKKVRLVSVQVTEAVGCEGIWLAAKK